MAFGLWSAVSTLLVGLALPDTLTAGSFEEIFSVCSREFREMIARPSENLLPIGAVALLVVSHLRLAWSLLRSHARTERARVRDAVGWVSTRGHRVCVLDASRMAAYSLPGRRGDIVVTSGLVSELEPDEFQAVILHETAHIELRHHRLLRLVRAVGSALAFLPTVRWLVRGIELSVEEDADEFTVAGAGGGLALASALSATALSNVRAAGPSIALGGGHDVARRVRRILDPPAIPSSVGLIGGASMIALISVVVATHVSAAYAIVAMAHHVFGIGTATMCSLGT